MKPALLFLFAALPVLMPAQLPLRHYIHPTRGNVVQREQTVYEKVQLSPDGLPLLPAAPKSRLLARFSQNQVVEVHYFDTSEEGKEILSARMDFVWENGRIVSVREWVGSLWNPSQPLKLHATFLHNYTNGALESENVLDGEGKLLSTLKYLPTVYWEGLPLMQFEEYRIDKGEMKKGDRYGVQHDTSGRVSLHFQIKEGDTVFYQRTTMAPGGVCRMEIYTASTRKFTEVSWKIRTWYDGMGNPLLVLNEHPGAEHPEEQYTAIVYRYQYQGESDFRPGPEVIRQQPPVAPAVPPQGVEKIMEEVVIEAPPPPREATPFGGRPAGTGGGQAPKYAFPYQRYQENGKFGCKDAQKRRMIPPDYDEIELMFHQQGILRVRQGKLWGVVDPDNRVVLPLTYTTINVHGDRLMITDSEKKTGLARKDGAVVIPCAYEYLNWDGPLSAYYAVRDGKVTLLDRDGNLLLAPKYSILRGTQHRPDLMVARLDGRYGVVERTTDRVIIPFEYEELDIEERFMDRNGEKVLTLRAVKDGKGGAIDLDNQPIIPFEYKWVGLAADRVHFLVRKNNRVGLLRQDLSVAIPIQYFQIYQPVEKIYMTLNEQDLWGVRTADREIVPEKYVRDSLQVTGKVIRVKNGSQSWLYSQTGAFEPFLYTHWETFARSADWVHTYYLSDGRKCLVSSRENDPPAEFFDRQTRYETNHGGAIIVLQHTDEEGQVWHGIRNGETGQSIAPMIYRELDRNVTLRHTDRFTREKGNSSEFVCALGKQSPKAGWMLIGSKGSVVPLKE